MKNQRHVWVLTNRDGTPIKDKNFPTSNWAIASLTKSAADTFTDSLDADVKIVKYVLENLELIKAVKKLICAIAKDALASEKTVNAAIDLQKVLEEK